jgi:hypothetical protein
MSLAVSRQNRARHQVGEAIVLKPPGSGGMPIQHAVLSHEGMSGSGGHFGIDLAGQVSHNRQVRNT